MTKRALRSATTAIPVLLAALLVIIAGAALLARDDRPPKPAVGDTIVRDERGVVVALPRGPHEVALFMGTGAGEYLVDTARPGGLLVQPDSDNAFPLHNAYLNRAMPALGRVRPALRADEASGANVEALLARSPGPVLVTWARLADRFERAGLPVIGMEGGPSTPERHLENARVYGEVSGRQERTSDLAAVFRAERLQIATTMRYHPERRPRVATVEFGGGGALRAFPLASDEAAVARGRDAIAIRGGAAYIDAERLLAADPAVLVIPWPGAVLSTTPGRLAGSPLYASLRAVRCGRALAAPPGVTGYATSIVEQPIRYRWLAEALHPDLPPSLPALASRTYARALGPVPTRHELARLLSTDLNPAHARPNCA